MNPAHAPNGDFTFIPVEERFWAKVDKNAQNGCWEWRAATFRRGYGAFQLRKGELRKAHRISWELLRGPIPDGLDIDHLCGNTGCVNPDHLEPVTRAVNLQRRRYAKTERI
jgi:hypothetical protein